MTQKHEVLSKHSAIERESYPQYRYLIAVLIIVAHFSIGLNFYPTSPMIPLVIDEYKISGTTTSLLVALPTLVHALVGLPGSVIINRFGLKRIFLLGYFMMGTLILSAWAPNFLSLLSLRLVFGIGVGFLIPATGPLVMQWFKPKERPVINSLYLIVMSLGIAISISVTAPLSNIFPWQGVLGMFGGVGFLGALAWLFLGKTRSSAQDLESAFSFRDVWSILSDRTIFLLVFGDALVFIQYAALTNWLPTYFHEVRNMSLTQAGFVTGLLPFIGMFAVLVGGLLIYKVKEKRLFFIIPGILVGLGGFGSFLVVDPVIISVCVVLLGIGTWVYQPMLLTLPMELPWMTPKKNAVVWGSYPLSLLVLQEIYWARSCQDFLFGQFWLWPWLVLEFFCLPIAIEMKSKLSISSLCG